MGDTRNLIQQNPIFKNLNNNNYNMYPYFNDKYPNYQYDNNEYNSYPRDLDENSNNCYCVKSYFRVLNALVEAPALDVYVNEMLIASNLKFGEFSRYLKFMPGSYSIIVYPSGNNSSPIFESNIIISRNLAYTGVIAGEITDVSEISVFMIPEEKEHLIMNRMASVTLINMSPDSPPLQLISEDGTVLFSDIYYGDVSTNVAIPSGMYTLNLRSMEDEYDILTAPNVDFAPKMYYTLFVIGKYDETPKIELIIPEDGVNYLGIC